VSRRPRHDSPPAPADAPPKPVRCAIYTRKSTDAGLEREFHSLDAQRDAAEAYVAALKHEGWQALPDRYDDGGRTGANLERPALQRLLAAIEAGRIDCVVVYKVDRLSRSLGDFARLVQLFEAKGVSFVSVTQQFHTGSSMGRLVLNVLLSFAQFERDMVCERTRDKVAAARRKGLWTGGRPVLGYAVERDARGGRLVVVPDEASRVRDIYALYLDRGSLLPVVEELARRGWLTKAHALPDGRVLPGRPFDRTRLHQLLTNVTYAGKVAHKGEAFPGRHEAVVDDATWQAVQARLARGQSNASTGTAPPPGVRNRSGALLRGLLKCVACGCAMTPTHAKKGTKRYRYYACVAAQKAGHATCPAPTAAAEPLERLVVEQVAAAGRDPALQDRVFAALAADAEAKAAARSRDLRLVRAEVRAGKAESRRLAAALAPGRDNAAALAALTAADAALADRQARLTALTAEPPPAALDASAARRALTEFAPVWGALTLAEREALVREVVGRVDRHPDGGRVTVTLKPTLIAALTNRTARSRA
jgi:site-specific DNA recombinase